MRPKDAAHPRFERTVVLVKPDGVARGLVGEILSRFEQRGLKLIALKMVLPTREHSAGHYSGTDAWLRGIGEKTLEAFKDRGVDVVPTMGTEDPVAIGRLVEGWNVDYLASGPVVAMIIEGMHAITTVRKLVGHTMPVKAEPGTIRGDLSIDSNIAANMEKRTVRNVIHASGDPEEAAHEIEHWFSPEEIHDYKRADEDIMFS